MLKINLGSFVLEYKFHPSRKWRFDWAYPENRIAFEYEGIVIKRKTQAGGRHVSIKGFSNDCEKYNEAQLLGWKVYRLTAIMVGDGRAIALINKIKEGQ